MPQNQPTPQDMNLENQTAAQQSSLSPSKPSPARAPGVTNRNQGPPSRTTRNAPMNKNTMSRQQGSYSATAQNNPRGYRR